VTGIPIIRLTLEGMKAQVLHAFSGYEAQLADDLRAAVDAFCTPENIRAVVDREVATAITAAVRDEVDRFYRTGAGRAVIAAAVADKLSPKEKP